MKDVSEHKGGLEEEQEEGGLGWAAVLSEECDEALEHHDAFEGDLPGGLTAEVGDDCVGQEDDAPGGLLDAAAPVDFLEVHEEVGVEGSDAVDYGTADEHCSAHDLIDIGLCVEGEVLHHPFDVLSAEEAEEAADGVAVEDASEGGESAD